MKKLIYLMVAIFAVTMVSCDKGGDDGPAKSITVPNSQQLTQTAYADNTAAASGVAFTTTGAWTSSISETASSRAGAPEWISINPASGSAAGSYTINIELDANYTGTERTAKITINCSGEKITITITQEATTQAGVIPDPLAATGSGTITYRYDDGSRTETCNIVYVTNSGGTIWLYENSDVSQPDRLYFNFATTSKLEVGTYTWQDRPNNPKTWYSQKGFFKNSMGFYGEGGTITVSKSGEIYTLTLNWDVIDYIANDSYKTGKITGTYVGKIVNLY